MDSFQTLLCIAEEQPLSRSLPAALTITAVIIDEQWASWIKLELMGYLDIDPEMKNDIVVPEYRDVPGLWYDDRGRALALDDPDLAFINHLRLRQGVAELEGMALASPSETLRKHRTMAA